MERFIELIVPTDKPDIELICSQDSRCARWSDYEDQEGRILFGGAFMQYIPLSMRDHKNFRMIRIPESAIKRSHLWSYGWEERIQWDQVYLGPFMGEGGGFAPPGTIDKRDPVPSRIVTPKDILATEPEEQRESA